MSYCEVIQSSIPIPVKQCRKYFLLFPILVWWAQPQLSRGDRVMGFSRRKCLLREYEIGHWEIKLDLWCVPQFNISRSHVLAMHPFYPKYEQNQSPIRVEVDHLISHAPTPRSCHASSIWSQWFSNEHLKIC